MFGLFKKKEQTSSKLGIFDVFSTDMHSHILPGIDDGAKTVEESLALIDVLYNKGIRKFICTPHVYNEMYPNTPDTIDAAYKLLQPIAKDKYPDIVIEYAAEYYLDEMFDERLEKNEKLLCFSEKRILIEHGFVQAPPDILRKIFDVQMAGYEPIYAHPERYEFFHGNKKVYHKIYDAGCAFQVNLLSLTGYYGKIPFELATYLIENKLVSLVGSDIHHDKHIEAYKNFQGNKLMNMLIEQNILENNSL